MIRSTIFRDEPEGSIVDDVSLQRGILVVRYRDGRVVTFIDPPPAVLNLHYTATPMPSLTAYVGPTVTHVDVLSRPVSGSRFTFLKRFSVPQLAYDPSPGFTSPPPDFRLVSVPLANAEASPSTRFAMVALRQAPDGTFAPPAPISNETYVNAAPVVTGKGVFIGRADQPLIIKLASLFMDPDTGDGLDALTFELPDGAPSYGVLSAVGGVLTVNTYGDEIAEDFGVQATDRNGASVYTTARVQIAIALLPDTSLDVTGGDLDAAFSEPTEAGTSIEIHRANPLDTTREGFEPWQTVALTVGAMDASFPLDAADAGAGFRARLINADGRVGKWSPDVYVNRPPEPGKPGYREIVVPYKSIDNRIGLAGILFDPDGGRCTYELIDAPAWVSIDNDGKYPALIVNTVPEQARTVFTVEATDPIGASTSVEVAVTVGDETPPAVFGVAYIP